MKTYEDIKIERDAKVSSLIAGCKMFFAFSNEQFLSNKTELMEGEKYISLGAGAYMPKSNIETYKTGVKDIDKWFSNEVKTCRNDHILYELQNHESFYTGDISDAMEVLKPFYTLKQVQTVYNDFRKTPEYQEQY